MKIAGIVLDNYKRKQFRKNLREAGFEWEEVKYDNKHTVMKVSFKEEDFNVLQRIVRQSEAQVKGL